MTRIYLTASSNIPNILEPRLHIPSRGLSEVMVQLNRPRLQIDKKVFTSIVSITGQSTIVG